MTKGLEVGRLPWMTDRAHCRHGGPQETTGRGGVREGVRESESVRSQDATRLAFDLEERVQNAVASGSWKRPGADSPPELPGGARPRQHLAFRASDSRAGKAHLCCFQLRSWPFVAAATGTPHGRVGERDVVSPRQRPRLLKPLLPSSAFSRGHFRRSQSSGVGCRGVGCRLRANARNHHWVSELTR